MSDNILSQAEIDALLNGDSPSEPQPADTALNKGKDKVRPYDPNTQRRVIRERMQSPEIINERFARQFRMGLFNMLRRSPDITVGGIKIEPYHEFARNLPVPTNLNLVHMPPLHEPHCSPLNRRWSISLSITCSAVTAVFRSVPKAGNSPTPNSALSTVC